jgi:hypothetical protein
VHTSFAAPAVLLLLLLLLVFMFHFLPAGPWVKTSALMTAYLRTS